MLQFIWVFTVCQSTHLGVSGIQHNTLIIISFAVFLNIMTSDVAPKYTSFKDMCLLIIVRTRYFYCHVCHVQAFFIAA